MQDIFRLPDMKLCIRAQVDSVCLVNGVLADSPELNEKFAPFLK
jgi:acyl-CoA thioester hydrolase